ncbi:MAG: CRTAC1 family protein [Thermoanaerobaculia bacterium]
MSDSRRRRALALRTLAAWTLWSACSPQAPPPLFRDVAAQAGLHFRHDNGMTGALYLVENLGAGVALVDYDGDGDLDVYLRQGHRLDPSHPAPETGGDRLFRNDLRAAAEGTRRLAFLDVTPSSRLAAYGYGIGVAAGDVDGDGDEDLYLTDFGPNRLWLNDGDGTFSPAAPDPAVDDPRFSTSAALADYDGDGRLDLYVVDYLDYRLANARPCLDAAGAPAYCGPQGFGPVPDRLLHNVGDGRFEDVTVAAGLRSVIGKGLGVASGDFDGDGRLDFYVSNDLMANQLWLQHADGAFRDEAVLRGAAVNLLGAPEASMGTVAADLDDDLDEDVFLTHLDGETNTLYRNRDGVFEDRSEPSGLGPPSWNRTGFGAVPLDYDLDGLLDLAVVNGSIQLIEEQRRAGLAHPLRQAGQLFHNLGEGRFEEVRTGIDDLAAPEVGRGLAVGDLDGDGDADLVVQNNNGPVRVLVREGAPAAADWLGADARPTAVAAGLASRTVDLEAGGRRQRRRFKTDGSFASASDPRALFGLGGRRPSALLLARPERPLRLLDPRPGRLYVFGPARAR